MKQLLTILLTAFFIVLPSAAEEEAKINILKVDRGIEIAIGATPEIYIDGPINDVTVAKFVATVSAENITSGTIYINSPGGNLISGIELGRIIRKFGFSTNVGTQGEAYGSAKPGGCFSACVLAYIGVYYRFLNASSLIGVHRFSTPTPKQSDLDVAQVISAAVTGYLKESDVDIALFNRMSRTAKDEIYLLSVQEGESLGVVNNGTRPAIWTLQSAEEIMYLKGEQETWRGIGKLLIMCRKGVLLSAAFYGAGSNAPAIAKSTWRYSLRINDEFSSVNDLIRPVQVSEQYVVAYFQPTEKQTEKMLSAQSVGFAFHPQNHDLFYGFQVGARDAHQKLSNYIKYCSSQRN